MADEPTNSIEQILSVDLLAQMAEHLCDGLGIQIDIFSLKRETIFPFYGVKFSDFCQLLRNAYGTKPCRESDSCIIEMALQEGKGVKRRCIFGFWDYAAPISLSAFSGPIGTVVAGQVRDNKSKSYINFRELAALSGRSEHGVEEEYDKMPIYSDEFINLVPDVLNAFAKNLGQLAEHKIKTQGLFLETGKVFKAFYGREQVFDVILNGVKKIANAEIGSLFIADWGREILHPVMVSGELWADGRYFGATKIEYGFSEGLVGRVFKTGKAEVIPDVSKDLDYICLFDEVRSAMVMPIIYGDSVNGVVLLSGFELGQFDEACLNETESLLALASAGLPFAILSEYMAELNKGPTLATDEEMLEAVFPIIADLFGYPICSVWLLDETLSSLNIENSFGCQASIPQDAKIPVNRSISGRAIRERKPVMIPDVTNCNGECARWERMQSEKVMCLMSIPLIGGDQVLGVLNMNSRIPMTPSVERERLSSIVGTQLATALYQRKLVREHEYQVQELISTGRVALAGAITVSLMHKIKSSLKSLTKGIKRISESDRVRGTHLAETSRSCKEEVKTLSDVVNSTLPLIRRMEPEWHFLDLSPVIKNVQRQLYFSALVQNAKIETDLPKKSIVGYTDEFVLSDILTCLVINSLEAHARRVVIRLGAREEVIQGIRDEYAVIEVDDDGIGVSEKKFEESFKLGVSSKPPGKGTGLGLFISREFARLSGGEVKFIKSVKNKSTIVAIYLRQ